MKKLLLILSLLTTSAYANTFTATYHVPVKDVELEDFSHFVMSDVTISKIDGKENMQINLPEGLIGSSRKEIKMRKIFSPIPFVTYYKGDGVGAACAGLKRNKLTCKFKGYQDQETNLEEVRDFWTNQGASLVEIEKRVVVAERFSSEPIGKLILKKK